MFKPNEVSVFTVQIERLMAWKKGLEYSFLNKLTRVFAHVLARELSYYESKSVCSSHIHSRAKQGIFGVTSTIQKCTEIIELVSMTVFRHDEFGINVVILVVTESFFRE